MKYKILALSAVAAFTAFSGTAARADNMTSIAITPATGAVTLTPRWTIGGSLAGFHLMAQDLSLGGGANQFYSIKGTTIPAGGDVAAFTRYIAASGAATNHADIGSKLTPDSYSALTSADPDVGYGPVNLYLIHHKGTTDYFTALIPSSATASAVTDEKPMSGPGGPGTVTGVSGYFGLTFAAANLGYGLNIFYYLRTDPVTGVTKFGTLAPALLASSADQFDLGTGGHNALTFTGTDVGYGVNKMYYLRLDPVTGFTILGTLDPALAGARHTADIANLGSVYSTLDFAPSDVGFGSGRFYATGAVNPAWQSVSFAAVADRAIGAGSFTVAPSASSGLPIVLTVMPGSVGAASISGPVAGVFTVAPTAPGVITLQATQAGQAGLYESNMLRQSFTATGVATLAITTQPTPQGAAPGATVSFSAPATGTTALSYQWRKAGVNITGNPSATTATLTLTNVQTADAASYDVVVTNASGSIVSSPVTLTVAATPIVTTTVGAVQGVVGAPFGTYQIAATGSPTSYAAFGLPTGLSLNPVTGAINGTPTVANTWFVTIQATNAGGTGSTVLMIVVAPVPSSRIVNFSARALSGPGDQTLIVGFVVSGASKNLLIRGIGPTLASQGVVNFLADPMLTLYDTQGAVTSDDNWGTDSNGHDQRALMAATAASVGAFALPGGSKDAALLLTVGNGAHTTSMVRPNSTTGVALTEIYDLDTNSTSRLVNVSARMNVTLGEGTLIAGFVISGNAPKTVLVRGVGPALAAYGVAGVLADPQIAVFAGASQIASNDNWDAVPGTVANMTAVSARLGAFPLPSGSKDAALLVTLQPGVYTVQVTGVNNTTGVALVEVYDAQ